MLILEVNSDWLIFQHDGIETRFMLNILNCNIRPEDTYRRKIKLGSKTTGHNREAKSFYKMIKVSVPRPLRILESGEIRL